MKVMLGRLLAVIGLSLTVSACAATPAREAGEVAVWPKKIGEAWVWQVEADYADVRQDLQDEIEGRGIVISYVSHAKAMLDRTGRDIGFHDTVYPNGSEILLFCKADISQRLVRDNPHHVVMCPYAIAVYDVQGEPGKVYLSFRDFPDDVAVYQPVEALLRDIIESVVENY